MRENIPDGSIDMIMCDLPYGVTKGKWDCVIPFEALWEQYTRVIKENGAIVLTASHPFTVDLICSNRKLFRYELIWQKNRGTNIFNARKMPMRSHENILVFYKKLPTYNPQMTPGKPYTAKQGKVTVEHDLGHKYTKQARGEDVITVNTGERFPLSVLNFPGVKNNVHPTEKPVPLLEWLIKTYTNPGEKVLDNCAGSFSTGEAAIRTGRQFFGMEMQEKYYEIGKERLQRVWNEVMGL